MCLYSNALVLTSSSKAKEQFHPTSLISMFTFCIFVMQGIETIVEPANQSSKRRNSTCMHHHSSCKIRWQRRTLGARMLTHPALVLSHACMHAGRKLGTFVNNAMHLHGHLVGWKRATRQETRQEEQSI